MSSLLDTSLLAVGGIAGSIACLVAWRRAVMRDARPVIDPRYDDTEDEPLSAPPGVPTGKTPAPRLRTTGRLASRPVMPVVAEDSLDPAPRAALDDDEFTDPRCTGGHADLDRLDATKRASDADDEDSQVSV